MQLLILTNDLMASLTFRPPTLSTFATNTEKMQFGPLVSGHASVALDWKQKLLTHYAMVNYSMITEDFHYHYFRKALHDVEGVDYLATAKAFGVSEETLNALIELNVTTATAHQTTIEQYQTFIQQSKSQQLYDWKIIMVAQQKEAKLKVKRAMEIARQSAVNTLNQLPPHQQGAAFNVYLSGFHIVIQLFSTFVGQLKSMLGHVADFTNGVWQALVNATNIIKGAVVEATAFIRSQSELSLGFLNNEPLSSNDKVDILSKPINTPSEVGVFEKRPLHDAFRDTVENATVKSNALLPNRDEGEIFDKDRNYNPTYGIHDLDESKELTGIEPGTPVQDAGLRSSTDRLRKRSATIHQPQVQNLRKSKQDEELDHPDVTKPYVENDSRPPTEGQQFSLDDTPSHEDNQETGAVRYQETSSAYVPTETGLTDRGQQLEPGTGDLLQNRHYSPEDLGTNQNITEVASRGDVHDFRPGEDRISSTHSSPQRIPQTQESQFQDFQPQQETEVLPHDPLGTECEDDSTAQQKLNAGHRDPLYSDQKDDMGGGDAIFTRLCTPAEGGALEPCAKESEDSDCSSEKQTSQKPATQGNECEGKDCDNSTPTECSPSVVQDDNAGQKCAPCSPNNCATESDSAQCPPDECTGAISGPVASNQYGPQSDSNGHIGSSDPPRSLSLEAPSTLPGTKVSIGMVQPEATPSSPPCTTTTKECANPEQETGSPSSYKPNLSKDSLESKENDYCASPKKPLFLPAMIETRHSAGPSHRRSATSGSGVWFGLKSGYSPDPSSAPIIEAEVSGSAKHLSFPTELDDQPTSVYERETSNLQLVSPKPGFEISPPPHAKIAREGKKPAMTPSLEASSPKVQSEDRIEGVLSQLSESFLDIRALLVQLNAGQQTMAKALESQSYLSHRA